MKKIQILFVVCSVIFCSLVSYAAYDTLGATVTADGTRFAIWNPDKITPANVWVKLADDSSFTKYPLSPKPTYSDNGVNPYTDVYSTVVKQNLDGCQYFFEFNGTVVRDPYARMTTGYVTDPSIITNNGTPSSEPTKQIRESQYVNTGTLANPNPATCPKNSPAVPGPCTQVVVDLSNPDNGFANLEDFNNNRPALAKLTDSIIYELNVRDFTANPDSGIANGGTFTALAKSGKCKGQSTGLQHLKDLGITHIQIMPMYTYSFTGYSYNWGYNPLEYNVPQEVFSEYFDPDSTALYSQSEYIGRLQELQNMVSTYHENGLRVVMDVVFNHTYASSVFAPNSPKTHAYYITDPKQITEDNPEGYVDDTGCGNTVDVANKMVSNMVADSLAYWMVMYGVDGYRFDEMASFDYSIVSQWVQYLDKNNPGQNYIYYGEPWNCGSLDIDNGCNPGNISCSEYMNNGVLTPGVGCFNGPYRNAIANNQQGNNPGDPLNGGYIFNQVPPGTGGGMTGLIGQIAEGFKGSIRGSDDYTTDSVPKALASWLNAYANMPSEAINYISCHDGLCLWDQICNELAGDGPQLWSNKYFQQVDMFSAGILMTSQGIPFIYEGDEFLRSKGGNKNSYNAPLSVNWITWSNKSSNLNVFKYYKKLIAIRKANPAFTQSSLVDIMNNCKTSGAYNSNTQAGVMVGLLNDNEGNSFTVIYNCGSDYNYTIPSGSGSWLLLSNINDCGLDVSGYPEVGKTFAEGDVVKCCGTSVTILANTANPQKPVVPSL